MATVGPVARCRRMWSGLIRIRNVFGNNIEELRICLSHVEKEYILSATPDPFHVAVHTQRRLRAPRESTAPRRRHHPPNDPRHPRQSASCAPSHPSLPLPALCLYTWIPHSPPTTNPLFSSLSPRLPTLSRRPIAWQFFVSPTLSLHLAFCAPHPPRPPHLLSLFATRRFVSRPPAGLAP